MADELKLLPCPFCGSEAAEYKMPGGQVPLFSIQCQNPACGSEISHWDELETAQKAWNTRASLSREKMMVEALEKSEAAQANLVYMAERERELARRAREAFDLVAPFVAKFAGAVSHYNRTPPRFSGSSFNHDPDPSYKPALGVSVHGQVPLDGPTIGDLRMLVDAYELACATLQQQEASDV